MIKQPVILFDGVCNLCNSSVNYVIRHDPGAIFSFASLQGTTGQQLLKEYDLDAGNFNSFVLIQDNKAYSKSTAALLVAKKLKGISGLLYGFIIIPAFIRDAVYDLVARNRYSWFGKKDTCMIPDENIRSRFIN